MGSTQSWVNVETMTHAVKEELTVQWTIYPDLHLHNASYYFQQNLTQCAGVRDTALRMPVCVARATTVIQTEISQQPFDGVALNFWQTFMISRG